MEIKGTAVNSIKDFVFKNYPDKYNEWFSSLPFQAQETLSNIFTSGWYPIEDAVVEPTKKMGDVFFAGDYTKAAIESGKYSAEAALHGIYKLYVKFSSPGHIIDRASRILPAYYRPSKMEIIDRTKTSVKLMMTDYEQMDEIIEHRISGWIQKALEISGCNNIKITIPKSVKNGDETVFACSWN